MENELNCLKKKKVPSQLGELFLIKFCAAYTCYWAKAKCFQIRDPQPQGHGPVPVRGLLGIGLHSGRQAS